MKKVTILILFMTLIFSMNGIKINAETIDMDDLGDFVYRIENPDPNSVPNDYFGSSLDITDEYIVVGTPNEDLPSTDSGYVFVFDMEDGSLLASIENPNVYNVTGYDNFGLDVEVYGNYMIASATGEDVGGSNSGTVYVFDISDPTHIFLTNTLVNPNNYNTPAYDSFGYTMDLYGTVALITARGEADINGTNSGVVYMIDILTGTLLLTIENPNNYGTSTSDYFGTALCLTDDYIIVGTPDEDDILGSGNGVVYIFDRTDGTLLETIENPNYDTSVGDNFGNNVRVTNDFLVVSALGESLSSASNDNLSGVVYVFDINDIDDITLERTLVNPNPVLPAFRDIFGTDIATFDNYVVVSAETEDLGWNDSGAVYVFDLTDGTLLQTIQNPSIYNDGWNDYFGSQVGMVNDIIIVSAERDGIEGNPTTSSGIVNRFEGIFIARDYTVSFDSNGGTAVADITQEEWSIFSPPSNPTKDGYAFVTWYVDVGFTDEYEFSIFPSENVTLYARWVEGGGGSTGGGLTNNFMFMLVAIILYLTMLFLRFTTGSRIWNLFGVGILIYFIIQFSSIIPMVIVLIGFIIYQLYDTFLGGN